MTYLKIHRSLGTHDGSFHADEVTACALLSTFNCIDDSKIIRTRNLELLNTCEYVCDVGGIYDRATKRFDHHQVEYDGDLSSAGMVLLYLKESEIISLALYNYLNESLVLGVDAHDTGRVTPLRGHCNFSTVIHHFMPPEYDAPDEVIDKAFVEALEFVKGHLRRLLARFSYIQSCSDVVQKEMKRNKKVLIFDRAMPWIESFFEHNGVEHPALFVIMPSRTHWKLRAIPPSLDERMQVRFPLPKNWAGLLDESLKKESGIPGAVFCHKGRFISVWERKEDAIKALEITLGESV